MARLRSTQAANIVQNPSFEDGPGFSLAGWDQGPFFFGSTVTDEPGPQDGSRFAVSVCGHTDGTSLCFLHPLAQTLATDGGTFTLSFWFDLGSSQGDEELGFSGLVVQWGDQIVLNVGEEEKDNT